MLRSGREGETSATLVSRGCAIGQVFLLLFLLQLLRAIERQAGEIGSIGSTANLVVLKLLQLLMILLLCGSFFCRVSSGDFFFSDVRVSEDILVLADRISVVVPPISITGVGVYIRLHAATTGAIAGSPQSTSAAAATRGVG